MSTTYAETKQNEQNFPFIEATEAPLEYTDMFDRVPGNALDEIGGAESLNIGNSYLQEFVLADQSLVDESYDVKLDYELSFALTSSITGKIQLGGKYHQLDRTSDGTERYSDFQWGGSVARRQTLLQIFPWITTDIAAFRGISAHNFVDDAYDQDDFLNGRYEVGWTADIDLLTDMQSEYNTGFNDSSGIYDRKYYLRGVESYVRDYSAKEQLTAGYIMTELNIGEKLMLLPGIRYERNETEYFAFHIRTNSGITGIDPNPDSVTTNRSNENWFPSLNFKYEVTNWASIQGAAYKSTSRPSFRQISPLVIYPNTGNFIRSNNPWLEPSTAWNYDLGISVMKPKIGLFTIFGFYKEIQDLIFTMNDYKPSKKGLIVGGPDDIDDRILGAEYYDEFYLNANGETNLPINNPEKAVVKGIEFSWQTSFWYLPGMLRGLVLDVNYSIIDTRTNYTYFQSVKVGVDSSGFIPQPIYGQEYQTRTGPMEDQPESILNIILGWDFKGFSSRVSFRHQTSTVESLDSYHAVFDSYYDDFTLIDVMLKQRITENVSAFINMTNIGNHIDDYFYGEREGKPRLPTRSQFYGSRIQFGARFKL
jgi:TonB-dependent receptor